MITTLEENPTYQKLYNENEEFKSLCDQHLALKEESVELSKAKFLTESESQKLAQIKKKKLEIKDKLQSMIDHQES